MQAAVTEKDYTLLTTSTIYTNIPWNYGCDNPYTVGSINMSA